jgi:hypothetical protein
MNVVTYLLLSMEDTNFNLYVIRQNELFTDQNQRLFLYETVWLLKIHCYVYII